MPVNLKSIASYWPFYFSIITFFAGHTVGKNNANVIDPYPVAAPKAEEIVTRAEAEGAMRGICVHHLSFTVRLLHKMASEIGGSEVNVWIEQIEREMGVDSGWEVKEER